MAKIPRDIVDAIRERTDLVALISRHVSLSRKGRSIVGLCPFHQEKSPSFYVIPDKQMYHCFGCQAGGDCFRFLMTIEGLSFTEAVKELGAAAGIEIPERELTADERKQLRARATTYEILEAAAGLYESWLWTGPAGAVARAYLLEKRGLTTETVRQARLGVAPPGWSRMIDALHREGYDPEQVAEAGLARPRERGDGWYDTLRDRVIVPIRDERGRVVAFGGRLLEGDGPKYLNTPETRLYQKSHVLYGIETARAPIQQRGRVLVVEGYFDVISLHQAGFGEAVATCGTALTKEHLEKIRRLTRDVVLVMDADEAGLRAAERALPLFVEAGIQPWRVELRSDTGGPKDPDELVRTEGPEAFERVLQAREPLFEWVVQRKLEAKGTSALSKERALEEVVPLLARIQDGTLTSRVSARLDIPEAKVLDRIREHLKAAAAQPTPHADREAAAQAEPPPPAGWTPHRDANHLLWLLVHRYDQVADIVARMDPTLLDEHAPIRPVVARLVSGEPVASILPDVTDPGVVRALHGVVAKPKLYEPGEAIHGILDLLVKFARPRLQARLNAVKSAYERAIAQGEVERGLSLLQEKKTLQQRERKLDSALRTDDVAACLQLLTAGDGG